MRRFEGKFCFPRFIILGIDSEGLLRMRYKISQKWGTYIFYLLPRGPAFEGARKTQTFDKILNEHGFIPACRITPDEFDLGIFKK